MIFCVLVDHDKEDIPTSFISVKEQHGMFIYVCVCLCVCVCNTHSISNQPITGQQLSVVQAGDGSVMVWGDILASLGPLTYYQVSII